MVAMRRAALSILIGTLSLGAPAAAWGPSSHFEVSAAFVPAAKPGADGAVLVFFTPRDPQVQVNREPAPHLKLDPEQRVLVDRQPPRDRGQASTFDPAQAKALDPEQPVRIPVALDPVAPRGTHAVKASVHYFYCSKREGWCRKGKNEVEISVRVP
jgi:hypothetical protein